jgi:hypothetical protein
MGPTGIEIRRRELWGPTIRSIGYFPAPFTYPVFITNTHETQEIKKPSESARNPPVIPLMLFTPV